MSGRRTQADDEFVAYAASRFEALTRQAALLLGSERQQAEDLAQDVLIRMYRAFQSGGVEYPDGLARRVMVNLAISRGRRNALKSRLGMHSSDGGVEPSFESAVDDRDLVWRAVQALPVRQRAVIVLRYFDDLPYDEIASILGVDNSTVRAHSFKARKRLRQILKMEDSAR